MLQLVIPAYNEQDRLPRTLRELRRHLRDQRSMARPVEVIVVDNASTDGTAAVARAADSPAHAGAGRRLLDPRQGRGRPRRHRGHRRRRSWASWTPTAPPASMRSRRRSAGSL